jgi:hypothetical protein
MQVDRTFLRPAPLAAAFAVSLCGLGLDVPAAPCEVLLNEVLAGPARDWNGDAVVSSRDDEWIEIVNLGATTVDLAGFWISDSDSTVRIVLGGLLDPGARRVVYGLDAVDWQRSAGRSLTGLSLNNSGDVARLWRTVGPDTTQVDAYAFRSHEGASDRASGRRPDGGPWALFDGLNPYTGSLDPAGTGCLPSPGSGNTCGQTRVNAATWGRVKSVYR